jgi:hypothetical protein
MLYYNVKIDANAVDGKTQVFSQVDSFYVESERELTVEGLMDEAIKKLKYDTNYLTLDKELVYIRSSSFKNRNPLKPSDKVNEKDEYLYLIELKPKNK